MKWNSSILRDRDRLTFNHHRIIFDGLMRKIGFSTGALAYSDFRKALKMLEKHSTLAVELSALRKHELLPLLDALDTIDLRKFSFVSVHAPSDVSKDDEAFLVKLLGSVTQRGWPVVVHPDSIHDPACWHVLGSLLCIENMDNRKPIGRNRDELSSLFDKLPDASLCLDLGHSRQIDPTMGEARLILRYLGGRLREIHFSEVSALGKHEPISRDGILAFRGIAGLIPKDVPIILESVVSEDQIFGELEAARSALELPPLFGREA
jgi:hypothetical protein